MSLSPSSQDSRESAPRSDALSQVCDLQPMTLQEYYELERRLGAVIREVQGIGWRQVRPGFWRPALPFQTVPRGSARPPGSCWIVGYQHPLDDWNQANSVLKLILYENIQDYRLERTEKTFRRSVRRGLEKFVVREIRDVQKFVDEAWPVYCDFRTRTGYRWRSDRVRRDRFAEWAAGLLSTGKVRVFGAYRGERLVGVDSLYQVGHVVMGGPTFCHSTGLKDRVTDVLLHVLRTVAARCTDAVCLFMGLTTGKPSLDAAKLERGAVLVQVPAYCRLQPWAYVALRIIWPEAFRRLGLRGNPRDGSGDQPVDRPWKGASRGGVDRYGREEPQRMRGPWDHVVAGFDRAAVDLGC